MSSQHSDDLRDWFKKADRAACPVCGREDAAATSVGTLYCRSCGEVVGGAPPEPSRS